MKRFLLPLLTACAVQAHGAADEMAKEFAQPPHEAKPLAWWHWVNGNISKEGIRADLEDMKRVGLGGVQIFDVNPQVPAGPVRYGTEAWFDHMNYAIKTAAELGLDVTLQNCPGWATSGGPWVPVEDSMKRLVWSETALRGGKMVKVKLAEPTAELNFYRDVFVLAVPADSTVDGVKAKVTASFEAAELGLLSDGRKGEASVVEIKDVTKPPVLNFEYPEGVLRRLLTVSFPAVRKGGSVRFAGTLAASDDGKTFRDVREFSFDGALARAGEFTIEIPFPPTKAKYFQLTVRPDVAPAALAEVELSNRYRVENFQSKAVWGSISDVFPLADPALNDADAIPTDKVINLTDKVKDGQLAWDAPEGEWTILRIGYTTTGTKNHPVQPEAEGYEVDKMDAKLVREHFDHSLGRILKEAGPLVGKGKTVTGILIDSWEAGQQNWTPKFPAEFQKLRGYDMTAFMPVITGRVVSSLSDSEGFLQDYSRTIGDLICENYFGLFAELAHERGLLLYGEAYGGKTFDEFQSGKKLDAVMSEFWFEREKIKVGKVKKAASIAHLNGGKLVAAESFSSVSTEGSWIATPYLTKPVGDAAFANGLTVTVLHSYVHQPRSDLKPGFTLGSPGSHFGRLNTWWAQAGPWMDYLARSQYMLRQGEFVADFLFFRNAGLGSFVDERYPVLPNGTLPPGFDYDQIDPSHFPTTRVEKGRIRLPDGATYRMLVFPDPWVADLATLKHIKMLKDGGVPFIGPAPVAPIGREDMTTNRRAWEALVAELWPEKNAGDLNAILADRGITADCLMGVKDGGTPPLYLHRSSPEADIYFICNTTDKAVRFTADFRVAGKQPEIWNPVNGQVADVPVFQVQPEPRLERVLNGGKIVVPAKPARTQINLALDPAGSTFIVFRKDLPKTWVSTLTKEDEEAVFIGDDLVVDAGEWFARSKGEWTATSNRGETVTMAVGGAAQALPLTAPWRVKFETPLGKTFDRTFELLKSWPDAGDEELKWFSGTGSYATEFEVPADVLKKGLRTLLDLGEVYEVATVKINGEEVGTLWKPDFVLDVTDHLKAGKNRLEVVVANRWINRLMGDNRLPWDAEYVTKIGDGTKSYGNLVKFPDWFHDADKIKARQRTGFGTYNPAYSDFKGPVPSGLVGPVQLRVIDPVSFQPKN